MKRFRLAMVQHDAYLGRKQDNLHLTVEFVRKAKAEEADIVVFPEINISGHAAHESLVDSAETIPDGESVKTLLTLAKELDIYIAAGIVESENGKLYNTQFIVGPEGYAGKQRKIHLSMNEVLYFTPGDEIKPIQLPFAKVGIVICYDCTFPELSRCLAVNGTEVLLYCNAARHVDTQWIEWTQDEGQQANTVLAMKQYLATITKCRALENRCYVGVCNMTGESGKYVGVKSNHAGGCFIIDPYGRIIAESKTCKMENEMILADLEPEVIEPLREWENSPYVKRRPELYGDLIKKLN